MKKSIPETQNFTTYNFKSVHNGTRPFAYAGEGQNSKNHILPREGSGRARAIDFWPHPLDHGFVIALQCSMARAVQHHAIVIERSGFVRSRLVDLIVHRNMCDGGCVAGRCATA